ncbi:Gfo/Idh/MocA family protein [Pseudalkalibacillus caeni]|uniref:Gfo/Idh/MocA family oxidoreductase n=1 Tax=Exobacillus caeni TaxID=2574798 RepID=A0A5R9F3Z3_9BACL|nr:Gfo/Idh/MocA family oxidoreductase [Pseudalkalibacillus caeni]TLS37110.1 Gfo/Idh/MocA family oxidoreductase [Pseudalkalibacillus caeni]
MIRFGIIGTNWITERLLEAAEHVEDFQLNAVYSRTEEKASEFAEKYSVVHTYTSLTEMAESDAIDAVYIASPNSFHAEQGILFLNNNKHVLCEKPIASNQSELEKMIAAAKANDVLLMEAMKSTILPAFKSIQENLHKIGKIRRFAVSYNQYSSRYDAYKSGTIKNAFKPEFSNGALMDLGIYCLYPLAVLFGEPEQIKASGVKLKSGVDGEGTVLLTYNDMEAVAMYSKITDSALPSEIQGENGSIVITKISELEEIKIHYRDGSVEDISIPNKKPSMAYELEEFITLITNGKTESKINSFEHSLLTLKMMDEARSQMGIVFPADKRN